jgi:hypothetical protein
MNVIISNYFLKQNLKNNMKKLILIIVLFVALISRNESKQTVTQAKPTQKELAEGFKLVDDNCFTCHNPSMTSEPTAAPAMGTIKQRYKSSSKSKNQFVKDFIAFLTNPSLKTSKMPDAVSKYGLMPQMSYSKKQLNSIANYIYYTDIEKAGWYEKQYPKEKAKYSGLKNELSPLEKGQSYAMQTKAVLGKNLLNAINTKGTDDALEFCSTKALTLTDSMAKALDIKIKRVSDKNRSTMNKANTVELTYIQRSKTMLALGEKIKPELIKKGNKYIGYYPILTDKMCLQCHGKPNTEVLTNTLSKIQKLYPDDKAIGYSANELRGIWVVEMKKGK